LAKVYPKRYARAIFEVASESNELEKWSHDLNTMRQLAADAVLMTLLESPRLAFEDKTKMINERLPGISPLAKNLAYLLVARGRVNLIESISAEFHRMLDDYRGVKHAVVTTAVAMDETEKRKVESDLSAVLGKKLVIETRVDPAIIGGLVARIDGKLLEGSTRYKLETLKKTLER
jgi:F-type H+-transporting ATPase subunit delta